MDLFPSCAACSVKQAQFNSIILQNKTSNVYFVWPQSTHYINYFFSYYKQTVCGIKEKSDNFRNASKKNENFKIS